MKADQSIDCIGLYCPMPIVRTKEKMSLMKVGEVLEIVADDKGIKLDMPAWADSTGNEYLGEEEAGDEIKVYVKKSHD